MMRVLLLAVASCSALLALGCSAETSLEARVDDTEITMTTLHDPARDEASTNLGLRLGDPRADEGISFSAWLGSFAPSAPR